MADSRRGWGGCDSSALLAEELWHRVGGGEADTELGLRPSPATMHATLTRVISSVRTQPGDRITNTPEWTRTFGSEYVRSLGAETDGFG